MNKLISILFLAVFSMSASAQTFRANAKVYMDRTQGTVVVNNYLPRAIVCSGRIDGMTVSGNVVNTYMNNVIIYQGNHAYQYVYTNNYDRFMRVSPSITCRTL